MLFGKIGQKNFMGIMDCATRFCCIESTKALGYRTAAALRVCCDADNKQIHDIDVSVYLGNRLNSGRYACVDVQDKQGQAFIGMTGRRIGLGTKERIRAKRMAVKLSDFIGFSQDDNVLLVCDREASKIDFLIKLHLRDIYTLRLNNITERVANCLASADEILSPKFDLKWNWTRKLICLASLECLLRAVSLWENAAVRDECRNEAVIKLMLGDLLLDGIDGLDEYNMYSNDAEQRVKDSELLVMCGKWLANGGSEVAGGLRAGDLSERDLSSWKKTLEIDLGVVLPPLNKQGNMRTARLSRTGSVLLPFEMA